MTDCIYTQYNISLDINGETYATTCNQIEQFGYKSVMEAGEFLHPVVPLSDFLNVGRVIQLRNNRQQSTGTVNNIVIERYAEQRVKAYTMRELHLEMVANNIGTPSSRPGIIDKLVNRRKYLC